MRNISASALAQILEKEGTDPITLVQIYWTEDTYVIYGDRAFTPEIRGQLLDVGSIENVINNSEGSNSGSVSIRLNDTTGELKNIYNTMDIHKRPVYILQWFPPIPLRDSFIIFDGIISSPIIWKEGERTLTFEVLSKIDDLEVGFSAEEGSFEFIPPNLVGKAWPVIFGKVLHIPAVRINDIPSGFSTQDTGIDGSTQGRIGNIGAQDKINTQILEELERQCFTMAGILIASARLLDLETITGDDKAAGTQHAGDFGLASIHRQSDNPTAQQLYDLGTQYEEKGNEYLKERTRPFNVGVFNNPDNKALERNQLNISGGSKFPQKQNIIITINGAQHEGYFEGDVFTIVDRTFPFTDQAAVIAPTEVIDRAVATEYATDLAAQTFFYAIAGSTVNVAIDNYPVYYIVGIPWVSNIVVLAKKSTGITKYVVPNSYYTVLFKTFGTLQATFVVMTRPLSSRANEKWEDDIWINCTSPIGPNPVVIMEWLITHYTNQSFDTVTFNIVKDQIKTYQANFALLERKNALDVLKDIAYQSRCAIWFKGGRFYIKYLAKQDTPVDTITEDDIESGTMEVFTTETEDVVTKWEVSWRPRLDLEPPYKIVYRYHVKKYGMIADSYDCYIFNAKASVQKFALFWLLRKSNTWKKIRFSTFMTKLRLEPFDSVLIDFTYSWVNDPGCVTPTVGIVETAAYNSDTQRIDLVIWLPIRLGEMCPYPYAYPSDLDITYIFPQENDDGVETDVPGSNVPTGTQLYNQSPHVGTGTHESTPPNYGSGGGTSPSDTPDNTNEEFNPPVELNPNQLDGQRTDLGQKKTVQQRTIKPIDIKTGDLPDAAFPGFIDSYDEVSKTYFVNTFTKGLLNPPQKLKVKQLKINDKDKLDKDTPCIVLRNTQRDTKSGLIKGVEYTMQVPIWLKPKAIDSDVKKPELPPADEGTNEPSNPPVTDEGDQ